jgi:hydrogenase maturation protease
LSRASLRTHKTAVVGVGNLLMGDEGVGIRVIQALEQQPLSRDVALFDGGTALQALIGELAHYNRWIIVDAVNGGGLPGEIYRLEWDDLLAGTARGKTRLGCIPLSLHDLGVIETLMLERIADRASPTPRLPDATEIVILGIEPEKVELSLELSQTLERQLPLLLQAVRDELGRAPDSSWGKPDVHAHNEEEPS